MKDTYPYYLGNEPRQPNTDLEVTDSAFGLQAGLFTRDLHKALRAWDELVVGGVVVNDGPSWRVDNMPYGGVKDSGLGREGLRYNPNALSVTSRSVFGCLGSLPR